MNDLCETLGCAGAIILVLLIIAAILFLNPLFMRLCWNLAVCPWLGLTCTISYWQAFGVNFLLNMIGAKFVGSYILKRE